MADFSGLSSKKNRFGDTPNFENDGDNNLDAPEIAPVAPVRQARGKTGRTQPFSTRVSKTFNDEFRKIAFLQNLKKVELLELALEAYKEKYKIERI